MNTPPVKLKYAIDCTFDELCREHWEQVAQELADRFPGHPELIADKLLSVTHSSAQGAYSEAYLLRRAWKRERQVDCILAEHKNALQSKS